MWLGSSGIASVGGLDQVRTFKHPALRTRVRAKISEGKKMTCYWAIWRARLWFICLFTKSSPVLGTAGECKVPVSCWSLEWKGQSQCLSLSHAHVHTQGTSRVYNWGPDLVWNTKSGFGGDA